MMHRSSAGQGRSEASHRERLDARANASTSTGISKQRTHDNKLLGPGPLDTCETNQEDPLGLLRSLWAYTGPNTPRLEMREGQLRKVFFLAVAALATPAMPNAGEQAMLELLQDEQLKSNCDHFASVVLSIHNNLALFCKDSGRLVESLSYYRKVIRLAEDLCSKDGKEGFSLDAQDLKDVACSECVILANRLGLNLQTWLWSWEIATQKEKSGTKRHMEEIFWKTAINSAKLLRLPFLWKITQKKATQLGIEMTERFQESNSVESPCSLLSKNFDPQIMLGLVDGNASPNSIHRRLQTFGHLCSQDRIASTPTSTPKMVHEPESSRAEVIQDLAGCSWEDLMTLVLGLIKFRIQAGHSLFGFKLDSTKFKLQMFKTPEPSQPKGKSLDYQITQLWVKVMKDTMKTLVPKDPKLLPDTINMKLNVLTDGYHLANSIALLEQADNTDPLDQESFSIFYASRILNKYFTIPELLKVVYSHLFSTPQTNQQAQSPHLPLIHKAGPRLRENVGYLLQQTLKWMGPALDTDQILTLLEYWITELNLLLGQNIMSTPSSTKGAEANSGSGVSRTEEERRRVIGRVSREIKKLLGMLLSRNKSETHQGDETSKCMLQLRYNSILLQAVPQFKKHYMKGPDLHNMLPKGNPLTSAEDPKLARQRKTLEKGKKYFAAVKNRMLTDLLTIYCSHHGLPIVRPNN